MPPRLRRPRWPVRAMWLALFAAGIGGLLRAQAPEEPLRGLPITRLYAFEEIADVSRGARLGFDRLGRITVIQGGVYAVLNDTSWSNLADPASDVKMVHVMPAPDGHSYFGALGSWGIVDQGPDGKVRPHPLVASDAPDWVRKANFWEMVVTSDAVYLSGWEGIVRYDLAARTAAYLAAADISHMFAIGPQVYFTSQGHDIQRVDMEHRKAVAIAGTSLGGAHVTGSATLDEQHVLLATSDGHLYSFDGTTATPWGAKIGNSWGDRVSALCPLVDGGVAIAINGVGLYLVSAKGEILSKFTGSDFLRITDMEAREPGVLWISMETGVEKLLYASPISYFGQRIGLPISWPQVVSWRRHWLIASASRLYESVPDPRTGALRFELMKGQPEADSWAIAARGDRLLVGSTLGARAVEPDGRFVPVVTDMEVSRLVMVSDDLCYVIGPSEIAVLRWSEGRWSEAAPRVPGLGYPMVVHATAKATWIELGVNRVARVWFDGTRLHTRLFDKFPWPGQRWVNLSVLGHIVVLTGPEGPRQFFDENTGEFTNAPDLARLFDHAPFWINRLVRDAQGVYWASYDGGIFTIHPAKAGPRYDTTTFDLITDRSTRIQLVGDNDVWISGNQSLFHVDRRSAPDLRTAFRPVLVSVTDGRSGSEICGASSPASVLDELPYEKNSLVFLFYCGSDATRRPPTYQYRLSQAGYDWTDLGTGSVLRLPGLREGRYRLDVRLIDSRGPLGAPAAFDFTILPPWYRTWYSYSLYAIGLILAGFWMLRKTVQHTHARNLELERLVAQRTDELTVTMRKLNEETRNAATLAERGRLAGEIHDSLQQGLSGLILQLDSTLKLPGLTPELRSRLSVARNMVSFTRHEVQNAVWNMESPLLEDTDLAGALAKIAGLIGTGAARIDLSVEGEPSALSSSVKHHLLRIAQEALTNAVRHAGASLIRVRLQFLPDAVRLEVSDDGCGFNPGEVMLNGLGHFGLRGLRGRAGKIGGELQVSSAPGQGTTIRIVVPSGDNPPPPAHEIRQGTP